MGTSDWLLVNISIPRKYYNWVEIRSTSFFNSCSTCRCRINLSKHSFLTSPWNTCFNERPEMFMLPVRFGPREQHQRHIIKFAVLITYIPYLAKGECNLLRNLGETVYRPIFLRNWICRLNPGRNQNTATPTTCTSYTVNSRSKFARYRKKDRFMPSENRTLQNVNKTGKSKHFSSPCLSSLSVILPWPKIPDIISL